MCEIPKSSFPKELDQRSGRSPAFVPEPLAIAAFDAVLSLRASLQSWPLGHSGQVAQRTLPMRVPERHPA